jgi:Putative adhesin
MSFRVFPCLAVAFACSAAAASAAAQTQSSDQVIVPLTDPSRPAVLSVGAFAGNIVVRGTNRRDVLVRSSSSDGRRSARGRRQPEPAPPGMRRLTPDGGFSVEERNNEVSVGGSSCAGLLLNAKPNRNPNPNPNPNPNSNSNSNSNSKPGSPESEFIPRVLKELPCGPIFDNVDFDIEVPLKTNVKLSTVSGDISVTNVEGVLEANSMNGDLSLASVAGSVVAHTVNGDVTAVLTRADAEAPMAFTTLNGEVDVTLPATIKANLKLRTDNGDTFTDFDIPAAPSRPTPRGSRQGDGRFRLEVERAVLASLNGGGPDIELRSFNGRVYLRRGK